MTHLLNIFIIFLLVFMNGFFVAAEFAMVKIRKSRIETLLAANHPSAKYTKKVIDNLNAYLSACQLGITLASLGLGWIGEPAVASILSGVFEHFNMPEITIHAISFIIGFSFITACHIVLGELVPKTLSIISAEKISLLTARPLIFFYTITYPIIWLFNAMTNWILGLFGLDMSEEHEEVHTNDEIRLLMEDSLKHEMIDETEYSFIENIFGFSEKMAKEIMTPRPDMICIDIDEDSIEQIQQMHLEEQMTRYPVYQGDKDNIIGFINMKDFYTQCILKNEINIRELLRKPLLVPKTISLSKLLKAMQHEKFQMAILLDEYGGTAGLVTTEDLLEEIVGSIKDEFDEDEIDEIQALENGEYLVSGALSTDEASKFFHVNIEAAGIDTLGGWIISQLKAVPSTGESILYENLRFTIAEMIANRISLIRVTEDVAHDENEAEAKQGQDDATTT